MRERDRRDFVPIISCLSAAVLVLYWQSWQLRTFRVRGWWQGRYKTIKSYRAFWQVLRLLVRFHHLVQLFVFAKRGKSQPQIYKLSMSFSATAKPPTESQSACQTSSPPQGTAHYIYLILVLTGIKLKSCPRSSVGRGERGSALSRAYRGRFQVRTGKGRKDEES